MPFTPSPLDPAAVAPHLRPRGRGIADAPGNRFEKLHVELDAGAFEELAAVDPDWEPPSPRTVYYRDDSQSIISTNASPDLGFEASLNPYRGCEHGCAYCYARPYHEYLGFNAGIDFETKIMVKENAAELLERALSKKNWEPQLLVCSGVTDAYQPVERKLAITRACMEVLARFRNPVGIVTKNHLVTRDADYLGELAREHQAARVFLSIPTLDPDLARVLEPRASGPAMRLRALRELSDAGIPVGVSLAPTIPGLNDHEMPAILQAAAEHGARTAFYTIVRLPYAVKDLFSNWLETHYPEGKERILGRVRELRGGKLNESAFGARMRGEGPMAADIGNLFRVSARRFGLDRPLDSLSVAAFRRPGEQKQMELF